MAGKDRTATDRVTLFRALNERPYQFDFFQALRRLEAVYRQRPRIGRSLRPTDDPIRLCQEPSLAFPPSTLAAFDPGQRGEVPRLSVLFGGLLGPDGPLPLHLTEYARDRIVNSGDFTFARFLDLFHHRVLSLIYRVWADAQPTVQYDRPENDRFAAYIGSLVGIGTASLENRDAMPDLAKRFFAGRLVCQSRHPEGLRAMLSEFFRLSIRVVEFVGQWLPLPDDCRCVLGKSPINVPRLVGGPSAQAQLGISATIGERVWNCQTRFRIVAGPMALADYIRLLPGGPSLARLIAVVRNYAGLEMDWDVHLVLRRAEVPETRLGSLGQLGWTTWLISRRPEKDAADLVLQPRAA
jgi:type VI secretion system protein ImpH